MDCGIIDISGSLEQEHRGVRIKVLDFTTAFLVFLSFLERQRDWRHGVQGGVYELGGLVIRSFTNFFDISFLIPFTSR